MEQRPRILSFCVVLASQQSRILCLVYTIAVRGCSRKSLLFRHEATRLPLPNERRVTGSARVLRAACCVPAHHGLSACLSVCPSGPEEQVQALVARLGLWSRSLEPHTAAGAACQPTCRRQPQAKGSHIIRWASRSNSRCHRLFSPKRLQRRARWT